MLLTLSTTHAPATELGYLLAKNPARTHEVSLAFGTARVLYPEASAERCTAALWVDVDPLALTARGREAESPLAPYVNDRSYASSSLLSVAIAQALGSALQGKCRDRPQLADTPIPLEAALPVVPCRGGEAFLRALFEPLGYHVDAERLVLDEAFPGWGDSRYLALRLRKTCRLHELLGHLYVLLPVLDDDKHYWVSHDEVDKLLRHGEGWLKDHPAREQIAHRYLRRQRSLTNEAMRRLTEGEGPELDEIDEQSAREEQALERGLQAVSLHEQRLEAVAAVLAAEGAARVIDLGCGEGKLLRRLLRDPTFTRVVGTDVSTRALEIAAARLPKRDVERGRTAVFQGSLTYRDARLAGFDAACAVEVIEHLDPSRLGAFERVVFGAAAPAVVVITTPNVEYNAKLEGLPAGALRHRDHRFEWTRAELQAWAAGVCERRGYQVRFAPIGDVDATLGAPTQMAVFRKATGAAAAGRQGGAP